MADRSTLRLFLALTLPEPVRSALCAMQRPTGDDVRWVKNDALHLTLVFLGERPARQADAIANRVGPLCAAQPAFDLRFAGLGCFPAPSRPRVLWAGIASGRDALSGLQGEIRRALARAGLLEAEERFSPHLTLGRVRDIASPSTRTAVGRGWLALTLPTLPEVRVEAVHLMHSERGGDDARYSSVRVFPLGTSGSEGG